MGESHTKPVSGRVPTDVADLLERVADETDQTRSQLGAQAVEYYVDENPDRIQEFYSDGSLEAFVEILC